MIINEIASAILICISHIIDHILKKCGFSRNRLKLHISMNLDHIFQYNILYDIFNINTFKYAIL